MEILTLARAAMKGRASTEMQDGVRRQITNLEVWRFLGGADTEVEIRIQRLRTWQTVSAEVSDHVSKGDPMPSVFLYHLAAMCGSAEWEKEPRALAPDCSYQA
eukprot:2524621-Heterocapsa_arctica.AAC.1